MPQMSYAELLWMDRLGMYVTAESEEQPVPQVVRVPFYRPVLDERDARRWANCRAGVRLQVGKEAGSGLHKWPLARIANIQTHVEAWRHGAMGRSVRP